MTTKYYRPSPLPKILLLFISSIPLAGCDPSDDADNGADGGAADESGNESDDEADNESENGADVGDAVPSDQDGDPDDCTGDLAADTFRFALCTCRNATAYGILKTGSFNSANSAIDLLFMANPTVKDFGAAIGVNLDLSVSGIIDVGGTAILAGPNGVDIPGGSIVHGDLKVDGDVNAGGVLEVARDLVVGNDFFIYGMVSIDRDLYLGGSVTGPAANVPNVTPGLAPTIIPNGTPKGQIIKGPVDVPPPCACGKDEILDISGMVADAKDNNQNDVNAIDKDGLQRLVGIEKLSLPSGRFYFSRIAGAGGLTLKVDGHTEVYVGGDLDLSGDLAIEMSDDATLDVFVAGDLHITGRNNFGKVTRPSSVRFYVAGQGELTLSGYTAFAGNLYAPGATVILTGNTYVYGSIFAGEFLTQGDTRIYYDRDVNGRGEECDDDDLPGDDPDDDTGDTCVPYEGKCEVDEDCCEPLVCDDGQCLELQVIVV